MVIDRYPLPQPEDLFVKIANCNYFSKIDLSQAYQQLLVDEKSRKYLTLSTHKGLFEPNRLMYGVGSVPGIFQREMEKLFLGMPFVVCYLDDILIAGKSVEQHYNNLVEVLKKLKESGLTVNVKKCNFFKNEIFFLGYKINVDGVGTDPEKIRAIKEAQSPNNVTELQAFLGMIAHYSKFVPDSASILYPLFNLLKKNVKWKWSKECDKAFNNVKEILSNSKFLVHFNIDLPLKLKCDASPYGIGGVLMHNL